jgi:hypothetical protein
MMEEDCPAESSARAKSVAEPIRKYEELWNDLRKKAYFGPRGHE